MRRLKFEHYAIQLGITICQSLTDECLPGMVRTVIRKTVRRPWWLGFLLMVFAGCGETDGNARFVPTPAIAESAVRAAMEGWKRGDPVGAVAGTKPVVQVIDSHRKPGVKLLSYEILGEVPGNAPRCFAVSAEVSNSDKRERLRYVVLGIDPLFVFRHEDFDMLAHWDHAMPAKEEEKKTEEETAKEVETTTEQSAK